MYTIYMGSLHQWMKEGTLYKYYALFTPMKREHITTCMHFLYKWKLEEVLNTIQGVLEHVGKENISCLRDRKLQEAE
jgi:hypothetical protein